MFVVGADPGRTGAVALIAIRKGEFSIVSSFNLKGLSILDIKDKLYAFFLKQPKYIFLEKVQAYQGEGANRSFQFGMRYGEILTLLTIYGKKYPIKVHPQTWQRPFSLDIPEGVVSKDRTKFMLDRIRPDHGIKTDGEWDAVLIALGGYLYVEKKTLSFENYKTLSWPKEERSGRDYRSLFK